MLKNDVIRHIRLALPELDNWLSEIDTHVTARDLLQLFLKTRVYIRRLRTKNEINYENNAPSFSTDFYVDANCLRHLDLNRICASDKEILSFHSHGEYKMYKNHIKCVDIQRHTHTCTHTTHPF